MALHATYLCHVKKSSKVFTAALLVALSVAPLVALCSYSHPTRRERPCKAMYWCKSKLEVVETLLKVFGSTGTTSVTSH